MRQKWKNFVIWLRIYDPAPMPTGEPSLNWRDGVRAIIILMVLGFIVWCMFYRVDH